MAGGPTALIEFAPAKINLTLRIGRRRPDGYHDLESLVVFADLGDEVQFVPAAALGLSVDGPMAAQAGPLDGNLVLKAAHALQARAANIKSGHFHLTKRLPAAAGLGGGSSDAAAALRLLARINGLSLQDTGMTAAALATGADVAVCLDPQPRIMRGIGDVLSAPLRLPPLHAVLVNARVPVPTGAVFASLAKERAAGDPQSLDGDAASLLTEAGGALTPDPLLDAIGASRNDLEAPALALFPAVGETLAALRTIASCRLARMSGSGGTCFGLFGSSDDAKEAAARIAFRHPQWWVQAAALGSASATPVAVPSP